MLNMNTLNTGDRSTHELDRQMQKQIKGGFFTHSSKYSSGEGKSNRGKSAFLDKFDFDFNGKKMSAINSVELTDSGSKIVNRIIKSQGAKVILNGKEM